MQIINKEIDEAISAAIGETFVAESARSVGGGSINSASVIASKSHSFFLKTNSLNYTDMFAAEVDGLNELRSTGVIRVPEPICFGETDSKTFLVLENIVMSGGKAASAENLGERLAKLHQVKAQQFGWYRNNTIGATTQINSQSDSWIDFYRKHRLAFQLSLAEEQGYGGELQNLGRQLCDKLSYFFHSYQPYPALLHGDLWSGNYAYDSDAEPVIFDPATYYGDREADIAMTELFGGFSTSFYGAYNDALPLDDGYMVRKTLYNLYHILNHLNLFGSGYHAQAISMMKQLLSE
ncbi:MAG: fructosamine kinase family protein [Gammaproteobacteria bacterium]|nr:fructosamine kinase family protein [Gammaproteobacteria bacterium]